MVSYIDRLNKLALNDLNDRETYILGDININLLCDKQKIPMGIKRYREFCALQGLTQIIENATRVTEKSSSLLGHILTNSKEKISQSGILDIGISDHQLIFCTRKTLRPKTDEKTFIKIRYLKNYSKDKLLEDLSSCHFPNYSTYADVNEAYSDFVEKVSDVVNKIAPMKEICIKNNTAEWVDEEVLEGIKTRDKLFSYSESLKNLGPT